ncbi:MAG TPA: putative sulfate exporter family transporter [Luteimicrobium sp.]|nr:putative sulfate exporter family transporter [Luteimicrobium sp.]
MTGPTVPAPLNAPPAAAAPAPARSSSGARSGGDRWPGLAVCAAAAALTIGAHALVPVLSVPVLALALGIGVSVALRTRPAGVGVLSRTQGGGTWAAKHGLRTGVVLLGLQLSLPQVLALGWRGLTVVAVTVAATLGGTVLLGRALRLPRATSLLVGTGFAICGAAAVSAMKGAVDPDEQHDDDAAAALALVTIFGSLAIVVLPWLVGVLGLGDHEAGLWIGASVQEVAQVVAAAGAVSPSALAVATVTKLARVVLLAPLVACVGIAVTRSRRRAVAAIGRTGTAATGRRPAPVPLFVVGFLAAVVLRSLGVVPDGVVRLAAEASNVLFAGALFAMGLAVDVRELVRTGGRVVVLGAASAAVATAVGLGAALLLG